MVTLQKYMEIKLFFNKICKIFALGLKVLVTKKNRDTLNVEIST